MKRVKLPEPVLPSAVWISLFFECLGQVFEELGHGIGSPEHIEVWRVRPDTMMIRDPHRVLERGHFRASVTESIGRHLDPTIARYARYIALGELN